MTVLSVGRLVPDKNLARLLQAFAQSGFEPDEEYSHFARTAARSSGATIEFVHDLDEAAEVVLVTGEAEPAAEPEQQPEPATDATVHTPYRS